MNYAVVRGADTKWGSAFAFELARQKRHLILLGQELNILEGIATRIRREFRVYIHCFKVDDSDMSEIVSICNHINNHFEVNLLINYAYETQERLADLDVHQLVVALKTALLSGPVYTHQLLPNLMFYADSQILELQDNCFPGQQSAVKGGESAMLAADTDVKVNHCLLPWTNSAEIPGSGFQEAAREVLLRGESVVQQNNAGETLFVLP